MSGDNEQKESLFHEDSDTPQLSAETMGVLLEFYSEQRERELKLQEIAEGKIPDTFDENWNLSQFWYTEETSKNLMRECLRQVEPGGAIACISCPTLYRSLRTSSDSITKCLFEYDTRFAVYKEDFVFYDFKSPLDIPKECREKFSVVVADPPYLSDDCLSKTAVTVKFIAKPNAKIILCTGAIMEETATKLLKVQRCKFPIKHHKSLSNPFVCYANYDLDKSVSSPNECQERTE